VPFLPTVRYRNGVILCCGVGSVSAVQRAHHAAVRGKPFYYYYLLNCIYHFVRKDFIIRAGELLCVSLAPLQTTARWALHKRLPGLHQQPATVLLCNTDAVWECCSSSYTHTINAMLWPGLFAQVKNFFSNQLQPQFRMKPAVPKKGDLIWRRCVSPSDVKCERFMPPSFYYYFLLF